MLDMISEPSPGKENTVSMMTLPPSMLAMPMEKSVVVEIITLRRIYHTRTRMGARPLLRAKST